MAMIDRQASLRPEPRPAPGAARVGLLAFALAFAAAAPGAGPLAAQRPDRDGDAPAHAGRTMAQAVSRTGPIDVDGRLDEQAWADAPVITHFVQREPIEGAAPEEPTRVRVLFDDDALYVGARMVESDTSRIARQLVRRDDPGNFDSFEISLDPNRDGRTGYRFRVSASNVKGDDYLYDDDRNDDSWDAVWQSAVAVDSAGWTAEIRIPLSQIRFQASPDPQTWGVNFSRQRIAAKERVDFALQSRLRHGKVSQFGRLGGILLTSGSRRAEVRPYALGRVATTAVDPQDPFAHGTSASAKVGGDVRYGLGSNFALDATVNPDFGQVEVDPAVVNLSAFETFYPEKRPFFVEDARIFDFNLSGHQNSLFYSRRIGRRPPGDAPDGADYVDSPDQTTILGAGKLTGRTAGGLSAGVLAAATGRELGRAYFVDGDSVARFVAAPATGYGVARVQQDFGGGASQIGGIVTSMTRALPGDGSLDALADRAFSGGVDFEHTWSDREWAVWGFLAGTWVHGSTRAILDRQESSSHYFQRPDAGYLSVDSAAASLTGAEWRVQLDRRSGRHWTGGVWAAERTPGFDANDLGFFQGSERLDGGARLNYEEIEPGAVLRNYRVGLMTYNNWRHSALSDPWSAASWGHAHKSGSFSTNFDLTFLNYWSLNLDLSYSPELLDDAATRGGPLMVRPASRSVRLHASTDRRAAVTVEPNLNAEWNGPAGSSLRTGVQLTLRPSSRFEIQLQPEVSHQKDAAQYVTSVDDAGFAPTYGGRYLFGELERRSFSVETRLNVAFSPYLTLQLFAQPLLSTGSYGTFRQLARAESYDFIDFTAGTASRSGDQLRCVGGTTCTLDGTRYIDWNGDGTPDTSFDDPDFRIRSLRGNAVLRWEYRPGSTLYLVWQQNRYERDQNAVFRLADAGSLFSGAADNVLILKASYWLGI